MANYLFVYGTLRRRSRHPMARRLTELACHVGSAKIAARLFDLGRYPGVQEAQSPADWVQGDVFDLGNEPAQTLQELDAYEGVESPWPAFFERGHAQAVLPDGRELPVWVYWFRGDVQQSQHVTSGSYEKNCDPE